MCGALGLGHVVFEYETGATPLCGAMRYVVYGMPGMQAVSCPSVPSVRSALLGPLLSGTPSANFNV